MEWTKNHLIGLDDLSAEEINHILDQARSFKEVSTRSIKKVPALRGRVVVNLFFEPSTRTRTSFDLAAQRLSADVIDFSSDKSSTRKGETLIDTARNVEAMGVDIIVMRHTVPGAPLAVSRAVKASVVNAGDGAHEHPTQALLDAFTILERKGRIEGLRVALLGDISHSRVARSNIYALTKLGAEVSAIGPPTLVPSSVEKLGVKIHYNLDDTIGEFDVINILRIQHERMDQALFPSIREYSMLYGINEERLSKARKDVLIMHPGPMNRGIEITPEVADGKHSVILEQVANGLAIRMAVLYLVSTANRQADQL